MDGLLPFKTARQLPIKPPILSENTYFNYYSTFETAKTMQTHPNTTVSSSLAQLEILGFDRVGFVEEVTRFTSDYGKIVSVRFEADGVRSQGLIKIKLENADCLGSLLVRLKAITGLVKVKHLV